MTTLLFLGGLAVLIAGAELLVRGASRLATALGIPPLIVGLTVVAFGTSSPELAVSLKAAFAGQAEIAVGNVVGSNIFNVLFILGLSSMVAPLIVSSRLVRLDVPLMIAVSAAAFLLGLDGAIDRLDGLLLCAGGAIYTLFLIRAGRSDPAPSSPDRSRGPAGTVIDVACMAAGLALLVLGSRWLVDASVSIARSFGVSELVIGLTLISAGTSLPEVVTSIVASVRGERDIAVGNIVGSNLFNLLAVLGISAAVSPAPIPVARSVLGFDLPVMIAVALACLPIFFSGARITRWEGALLFGGYVAWTSFVVLHAVEHDALPLFSSTMLRFVLPLVALTLAAIAAGEIRSRRSRRNGIPEPAVPARVDEITDDWIRSLRVFAPDAGGFAVARIGADYGLSSEIVRVRAPAGASPATIVVKIWDTEKAAGKGEVAFFRRFGRDAGLRIPACRAAALDPERHRGVLVLEDFPDAAQGDCLDLLDRDRQRRLARDFARFHRRWWTSEEVRAADFLIPMTAIRHDAEYFASRRALFLERYADRLAPDLRPLVDAAEAVEERANALLAACPDALLHADLHLDNMMFEPDGTPVILDWARAGHGPAILDLAEIAFLAGPPENAAEVADVWFAEVNADAPRIDRDTAERALTGAVLRFVVRSTLGVAAWNPVSEREARMITTAIERIHSAVRVRRAKDPEAFVF